MGIGLYSCTGCNSYCVTAKCGVLLSVPAGVMRRDCAAVRSRGNSKKLPNLFCDEICTSGELWNVDVLKPERQRLVLPKPWA